jgi:hypothetical protein
MSESKMFLFDRLSYYRGTLAGLFTTIPKGDGEEKEISSQDITKVIRMCQKRAKWYRFTFIVFIVLATVSQPLNALFDKLEDRVIVAVISSLLILIANFLAWPQYAEKMYSIIDHLENMRDAIDAEEGLSNREKQRLRRIIDIVHIPHLFSDKQLKFINSSNNSTIIRSPGRRSPLSRSKDISTQTRTQSHMYTSLELSDLNRHDSEGTKQPSPKEELDMEISVEV